MSTKVFVEGVRRKPPLPARGGGGLACRTVEVGRCQCSPLAARAGSSTAVVWTESGFFKNQKRRGGPSPRVPRSSRSTQGYFWASSAVSPRLKTVGLLGASLPLALVVVT